MFIIMYTFLAYIFTIMEQLQLSNNKSNIEFCLLMYFFLWLAFADAFIVFKSNLYGELLLDVVIGLSYWLKILYFSLMNLCC